MIKILKKSIGLINKIIKRKLTITTVGKNLMKKLYYKIRLVYKRSLSDQYLEFSYNKVGKITRFLSNQNHKEISLLFNKINMQGIKGIIIYPHAIHWEPVQRPQHLMREFGTKGYLCFFCDDSKTPDEPFFVKKKFENVYCVNKEEVLIEAFKEDAVIIYMTWFGQYPFSTFFNNAYLWYDIVDNNNLFALSGEKEAKKIHNYLIENANLVTYSSRSLKPKSSRKSFFIPNGVDSKLFCLPSKKNSRRGIIYIGAIDNGWFNWKALIYAAKSLRNEDFDIYGKIPKKHPLLPSNIHLKGFVPQEKVPLLLSKAKVGIIPFKKNNITDFVLPLKLFEYSSMGLSTVSMGLRELDSQGKDFIRNSYNYKSFLSNLKEMLNRKENLIELTEYAKQHDWTGSVSIIEKQLISSVEGLKVFANVKNENVISVISSLFFDYNGENNYSGGAERYLVDLYSICKSLGYKLRIFQKGNYNWMRQYKGIEVYGICNDKKDGTILSDTEFNKRFYYLNSGKCKVAIYSPFALSLPFVIPSSIGISHGVFWDNGFVNGSTDFQLCQASGMLKKNVSVDTNTCNWFQTRDLKIGHNIEYIPNYVNTEEFFPDRAEKSKIIILYPRRLYQARGFEMVLGIIDDILGKYQKVELHFVGRGFSEDTDKLKKYIKKWGKRILWYEAEPEEMKYVYKKATISLIPTMYSEGTSLSCLEAMATGNIVIATRVGGLTDLIINNYNGILIEPNEESLKSALEQVLSNLSSYKQMQNRAIKVAKSFDKKHWDKNWTEILMSIIKEKGIYSHHNQVHRINLKKGETLSNHDSQIFECLSQGSLVYISGEPSQLDKLSSFGRMQFIEKSN